MRFIGFLDIRCGTETDEGPTDKQIVKRFFKQKCEKDVLPKLLVQKVKAALIVVQVIFIWNEISL